MQNLQNGFSWKGTCNLERILGGPVELDQCKLWIIKRPGSMSWSSIIWTAHSPAAPSWAGQMLDGGRPFTSHDNYLYTFCCSMITISTQFVSTTLAEVAWTEQKGRFSPVWLHKQSKRGHLWTEFTLCQYPLLVPQNPDIICFNQLNGYVFWLQHLCSVLLWIYVTELHEFLLFLSFFRGSFPAGCFRCFPAFNLLSLLSIVPALP